MIAKGTIQEDDKKGLFSILDNLASGKITNCADGYKSLDNSKDFRAGGKIYCIPSSPFQSQNEVGHSQDVLNMRFDEQDGPPRNYPKPSNSIEPYTYGSNPCSNGGSSTSYPVPAQPQYNNGMGPTNSAPISGNAGMNGYPQMSPPQGTPYSPCAVGSPYKH
ncbi:MAG: hypothetical protein WCI18_04910 [Pseudomonadota bacterium]